MLTALFGFCVGFPAGVLTLLALHRLRLRASKAVPPSAVLEDTYGHRYHPFRPCVGRSRTRPTVTRGRSLCSMTAAEHPFSTLALSS